MAKTQTDPNGTAGSQFFVVLSDSAQQALAGQYAIVGRVVKAGYAALCLTVDTAVYSRRERPMLTRWTTPTRRTPPDPKWRASITWDLMDQIKKKQADQASARAADETELKQADDAEKTAELEMKKNEIISRIDAEVAASECRHARAAGRWVRAGGRPAAQGAYCDGHHLRSRGCRDAGRG